MARVRPYYAEGSLSARFYDVVTAADANLPGDVALYAALAPAGGAVLELGTGGGRIALALAEMGFSVTGIDLAPSMLAQAQARRARAPAEVAARLSFRLGDMTALALGRPFDLALCPYFTLAHVPAGAAWRNTFAVMAAHLRPGGLAAVHLPLFEVMRRPGPASGALVFDEPLAGGGRLRLHILERRFREPVGRLDQVIEYVEHDAAGRVLRRSAERLTYYIADPQPFALEAGLRPQGPPHRLGAAGDVWIFERPGG